MNLNNILSIVENKISSLNCDDYSFLLSKEHEDLIRFSNNSINIFDSTENISIEIYDLNGIKIDQLINNIYSPGTYSVQWKAKDIASGTYFIIAKYEKESYMQKIVLMK